MFLPQKDQERDREGRIRGEETTKFRTKEAEGKIANEIN